MYIFDYIGRIRILALSKLIKNKVEVRQNNTDRNLYKSSANLLESRHSRYLYVYMYIFIYVYIYICIYMQIYMNMSMYVFVCKYMYMYMYAYIYI
jgi:hypothetical protein